MAWLSDVYFVVYDVLFWVTFPWYPFYLDKSTSVGHAYLTLFCLPGAKQSSDDLFRKSCSGCKENQ